MQAEMIRLQSQITYQAPTVCSGFFQTTDDFRQCVLFFLQLLYRMCALLLSLICRVRSRVAVLKGDVVSGSRLSGSRSPSCLPTAQHVFMTELAPHVRDLICNKSKGCFETECLCDYPMAMCFSASGESNVHESSVTDQSLIHE